MAINRYALMSAWKTGMGIRSRKSLLINLPVSIYSVMRKHTIVSYWKFDTDYREAELIRLTIDDVESPILEGFDKFYPQALVSLDK